MSQDKKQVLLTYKDSNKVVSIPVEKSGSDFEYLTTEFVQLFKLGSFAHLDVTFQTFHKDWGEYVDLEQDDDVCDKDKLKVAWSNRKRLSYMSCVLL